MKWDTLHKSLIYACHTTFFHHVYIHSYYCICTLNYHQRFEADLYTRRWDFEAPWVGVSTTAKMGKWDTPRFVLAWVCLCSASHYFLYNCIILNCTSYTIFKMPDCMRSQHGYIISFKYVFPPISCHLPSVCSIFCAQTSIYKQTGPQKCCKNIVFVDPLLEAVIYLCLKLQHWVLLAKWIRLYSHKGPIHIQLKAHLKMTTSHSNIRKSSHLLDCLSIPINSQEA